MKVQRFLRVYEKEGDGLVGEYRLEGVSLAELQSMFGEPSDSPMYECYPVTPDQLEKLQNIIKASLNLQAYDYFVESDASD